MVRFMKACNISPLWGNLVILKWYCFLNPKFSPTLMLLSRMSSVASSYQPPPSRLHILDIIFLMGLPPYITVIPCTFKSLENSHGMFISYIVFCWWKLSYSPLYYRCCYRWGGWELIKTPVFATILSWLYNKVEPEKCLYPVCPLELLLP